MSNYIWKSIWPILEAPIWQCLSFDRPITSHEASFPFAPPLKELAVAIIEQFEIIHYNMFTSLSLAQIIFTVVVNMPAIKNS